MKAMYVCRKLWNLDPDCLKTQYYKQPLNLFQGLFVVFLL